jgi:hypothetical protein
VLAANLIFMEPLMTLPFLVRLLVGALPADISWPTRPLARLVFRAQYIF